MTAFSVSTNGDAGAVLRSQAAASGVSTAGLGDVGKLDILVANLVSGAATVPALTATTGTFTTAAITTANITTGTAATLRGSSSVGLGAAAGAAASVIRIPKAITAIADNTFTDLFTVTVPNQVNAALIRVQLVGVKGAGDVDGAGGSTHAIAYNIAVSRIAGAATVATLSTAYGSAVATGGTIAVTTSAQASSMTGATSATQTFTIQVKVARASSTSDNHTCFATAELLNTAATGVTIA